MTFNKRLFCGSLVLVRMYSRPDQKLNRIPEGAKISPYNWRNYVKPKQVLLRVKEDAGKIHEHMCLSEYPFGTVRWYDGAHYLLCKGKEKATAELGLSFLTYNLKRSINLVGSLFARLIWEVCIWLSNFAFKIEKAQSPDISRFLSIEKR